MSIDNDGKTPEEKAAERGLVVRYPGPRELFVDLDGPEQVLLFRDLWYVFKEHGDPDAVFVRTASAFSSARTAKPSATQPRGFPTAAPRTITAVTRSRKTTVTMPLGMQEANQ